MLLKLANYLKKKNRFRCILDRFGSSDYLHRYYILHKSEDDIGNEVREYKFNAFLHNFKASDDPVFHDHPWNWCSIVLKGGYWEYTPLLNDKKEIIGHTRKWRGAGSICFRKANSLHYVETDPFTDTWTLFMHGKRQRDWGFIVKNQWIHWKDYLAERIARQIA